MAQEIKVQLSGIKTNPSPITVDKGALARAENVVINSPNTLSSRRGFKQFGDAITISGQESVKRIWDYDGFMYLYTGSRIFKEDTAQTGDWSAISGTYTEADTDIGLQVLKFGTSFLFNTTVGIKRLESGTVYSAGEYKALGGSAALTTGTILDGTGSGNCFAYRIVWGREDADGVVHYGSPSDRINISNNTASANDVNVTFLIPSGITTSYFYQIYRSAQSGDATVEGNDELGLVYEANPTSGEISAGTITVKDEVPDSLRGATIYTAESQEGILQANDRPPFAKDMTLYKEHTMYANTRSIHRLYITLTGTGATNGLQIDDTITINAIQYTAKATETPASGYFQVFSADSGYTDKGSSSLNIAATARSLVDVINKYSSNTEVYAYYVSGFDDLPGKILIERRDLTNTAFVAISSRATCWNPKLPTSGSTVSSTADVKTNRVFISKKHIPEAVPPLQYIDIGSDYSAITRIIALRDSVFIFKDDGEIYRLIGEDVNSFQVALFDNTAKLVSPKTASVFNNQVWCFSDQYIVSLSDSGTAVMSFDIEDSLVSLLASSAFVSAGYGFAYESDRKYVLSDASSMFVYNSFTSSWTKWTISADTAYVSTVDDKMYYGTDDGTDMQLYQERKDFLTTDYADAEYSITINSVSGFDIVVADASNIAVDDEIVQVGNKAQVESISGNTITLKKSLSYVAGSATVYKPIQCLVETVDNFAGNPSALKDFREVFVSFRSMNKNHTVSFKNNFNSKIISQEKEPIGNNYGWGDGLWNDGAWGGSSAGDSSFRTWFPLSMKKCISSKIRITVKRYGATFDLNNISLTFEPMSEVFQSRNG